MIALVRYVVGIDNATERHSIDNKAALTGSAARNNRDESAGLFSRTLCKYLAGARIIRTDPVCYQLIHSDVALSQAFIFRLIPIHPLATNLVCQRLVQDCAE